MHTIEECLQELGNDLAALVKSIIPEQNITRWFYETTIPALGGTPADVNAREGSGFLMAYFERRFVAVAGAYDSVHD